MKFSTPFASIAKTAFAALMLFLISGELKAQDAIVHNFTGCDMVVVIYGTSDCSTVACIQNAVVPPGTSTITLPCTANVVYAEVTADCIVSPIIALATPGCACGGASNASGSFTVGAWTVNADQICSGSDIEIKIWD